MSGRLLRVAVLLGLLGYTLTKVPARVQEQRNAVDELAAERGAASAGGEVLSAMDDARLLAGHAGADVWWVPAGSPLGPAPRLEGRYADFVAAVREHRAERAARSAAARQTGAASLVDVDGDLYLVMPQLTGFRPLSPLGSLEEAAAEGGAPEAAAAPDAGADPTALDAAPGLDEPPTSDGRAPPAEAAPAPAPGDPVAPAGPLAADAPTAPTAGAAPPAGGPTTSAPAAAPTELPALPPLPAALAYEALGQHADGPVTVLVGPPRADGTSTVQITAPGVTVPAVKLPMLNIPAFQVPPLNLTVDVERDGTGLDALGLAPLLVKVPSGAGAVVAWWPAIQARVESRTGIPLQVGGEPPQGRRILGSRRLGGLPVWSLPTPETEATIGRFDGWSFLGLLLLGGLLGREAWAWRRELGRERDRQQTRDAILARLSHELRTPAASVRSLMDALDHPGTSPEERAQFLDLARSEAGRLASGIDRLLQAARGDVHIKVDPVPLDLAEWAEAVKARWEPQLPGLRVSGDAPCPAVADPERLDEAVDALLDNARKYGGPNVTLGVAPGRLWVEDDGEGIPPKDRSRVLQKFERVEGRVNDPGGHGLGLWAAGEVAQAHGGKITIDGRNRFVLTLGGVRPNPRKAP